MKQVLFALMVLVIAAWTAPVFGQEATLLDQVKGKTEAEVVTFMNTLNDDQLASLIAQAINAANNDPTNAATVALRGLVLSAGNKVLNAKPAPQQNAIIAAIQAAAPGTTIGKDSQNLLTIIPPASVPLPTPPPPPPGPMNDETNRLIDQKNSDSEPAFR
ncbi:MAG: hypothetical protein PHT80_01485 [Lentisphaeria bacterium]|nr:hypothetical protein [Lentisphaeria bacterium]